MEKISEMVNACELAAINIASSCAEPCGKAVCEGCLALTGGNLCDLGRKTGPGECLKLNDIDDYLIEHLRKM